MYSTMGTNLILNFHPTTKVQKRELVVRYDFIDITRLEFIFFSSIKKKKKTILFYTPTYILCILLTI